MDDGSMHTRERTLGSAKGTRAPCPALLICLVCLLWALFPAGTAHGETSPRPVKEVVDAMGRTVTVPIVPRRIIVLSNQSLEVIRTLGMMDRVVGVSSYIKSRVQFYPEIADAVDVGRAFTPDFEIMAHLEPDLVITWARWPGFELEQKFAPLGASVLRLDFYLPHQLERETRVLGEVFEATDRAEEYLAWNREKLEPLLARIPRHDSPRVFSESFTYMVASGPGSGMFALTSMAGAENINAAMAIPSALVDTEWIVRSRPEVLIKAMTMRLGSAEEENLRLNALRDEVAARPGWRLTPAVQAGRVHAISTDIGGGPRHLIGLAYMLKWFFPGRFDDVDPEALHREYLARFQGRELEGTFVSDPLPIPRP